MKSPRLTDVNIIVFSILWTIFIALLSGNISNIRIFFKINLIISSIFLIIFIGLIAFANIIKDDIIKSCLINPGLLFFTGSIGTIVMSTMGLAIVLSLSGELSISVFGLGVFFFGLMMLSFTYLISRIIYNKSDLLKMKLRKINKVTK